MVYITFVEVFFKTVDKYKHNSIYFSSRLFLEFILNCEMNDSLQDKS